MPSPPSQPESFPVSTILLNTALTTGNSLLWQRQLLKAVLNMWYIGLSTCAPCLCTSKYETVLNRGCRGTIKAEQEWYHFDQTYTSLSPSESSRCGKQQPQEAANEGKCTRC